MVLAAVVLLTLTVAKVYTSMFADRTGTTGNTATGNRPAPPVSTSPSPGAPTSSATPEPDPEPVAVTDEIASCPADRLKVTVRADRQRYAAGQNPYFTLELRNISDTACRYSVDPKATELIVATGTDRVWSSRGECGSAGRAVAQQLAAGATVTVRHVIWQRNRSGTGCQAIQPELAEAGAYTVSGVVANLPAASSTFRLG